MRCLARTAFALSLVALPIALHADTYNFTIVAGPQSGGPKVDPSQILTINGTLTGNPDPSLLGGVDITAITGGASGDQFAYTFAGVVAPGTTTSTSPGKFSGYIFDNVLQTQSTYLTSANGFLVYLDGSLGQSLAHVFSADPAGNNGFPYEVTVSDPGDYNVNTPFTISSFTVQPAVPEPSTLLLLATGSLGGAAALRRRFSSSKSL